MEAIMDKAKILNEYLEWRMDKELYPPRWTPEEFIEDTLNKIAREKIDKIHEELLKPQNVMETLVGIQEIMKDYND